MAPMDDPQFVILVVVDSPKGIQFGSTTAAPIAKEFMENALPYLGVNPKYTEEEEKALKSEYVYVPNVNLPDSLLSVYSLYKYTFPPFFIFLPAFGYCSTTVKSSFSDFLWLSCPKALSYRGNRY